MKKQRGQAFILVLILLALGSLMIAPILRYTYSVLRSQQISEEAITRQYAADSGVEQALWQMLNNILGGGSPSIGDFTFELGKFSIMMPTMPPDTISRNPPVQWLQIQVIPNWVPASTQNTTFSYIIRIQMPKWLDMDKFGLTLPPGLKYVANSTLTNQRYDTKLKQLVGAGPTGVADMDWNALVNVTANKVYMNNPKPAGYQNMVNAGYNETPSAPAPYLQVTNNGRTLEWKRLDTVTGNLALIQKFTATGKPRWGILTTTVWFRAIDGTATQADCKIGVAFYTVRVTVEGVVYEVIVAYDSDTGGFKIISYQIVG